MKHFKECSARALVHVVVSHSQTSSSRNVLQQAANSGSNGAGLGIMGADIG